VAIEHEIED
jgi:hypothetical protein